MRNLGTILTVLLLLVVGAQSASALSFTLNGSSITKINASMPGAFDLSSQFYDGATSTFAFSMTVDSIEFGAAATQQMSGLGNPLELFVNVTLVGGLYTNAAVEDLILRDSGDDALLMNFQNGGGVATGLGVNFATATLGGLYTLNSEIIQPDPTLMDAMLGASSRARSISRSSPSSTSAALS